MLEKILKKKVKIVNTKITQDDVEYSKYIIDNVFEPRLKSNLKALNDHLKDRGIRAGIEVSWYFDRIEDET